MRKFPHSSQLKVGLGIAFAPARFQLGSLYANERRFAEAIEQLRQAVKLDPDLADAHYRLGQAYERTGQTSLAARELEIFKQLKERK